MKTYRAVPIFTKPSEPLYFSVFTHYASKRDQNSVLWADFPV
ncbi:hypothetical protein BRUCa_2224 [Brucella melitensis]|nr:hypothetical protein BM28_B0058 [Brucella melitensis M28]ADZ88175.1 hypothetical protein BM590_B0058 [Brucella melitensis M5-90]AIB18719.1 Hypothetical protein BSSP3_II0025 [Brucella suis bv. 2]AIB22105.1 Hypothetical protein BSPT1_II0025 [Brucella suis bv. 2]AIB25460.1 Hypothetical protein BSPT2_II0025 [Brucella suis bv. 2]